MTNFINLSGSAVAITSVIIGIYVLIVIVMAIKMLANKKITLNRRLLNIALIFFVPVLGVIYFAMPDRKRTALPN